MTASVHWGAVRPCGFCRWKWGPWQVSYLAPTWRRLLYCNNAMRSTNLAPFPVLGNLSMTNSNSSVTALVTCDLNVLQLLYLKSDTERKITKSIFHVRLKCLKLFEKVVAKMFIYHQKFFSLTYIEESYCSLLIIEHQTSSSCTWMEGNKCIILYWSQDTKTSPSFTWIQGYNCILMWKKKKKKYKNALSLYLDWG